MTDPETTVAPGSQALPPQSSPAPEISVTPTQQATPAAPVPETPSSASQTATAQIPPNEPLPSAPEPFTSSSEPLPPPSTLLPSSAPVQEPVPPAPAPTPPLATVITRSVRDFLIKALDSLQIRKRQKLDRIMKVLQTKPSITNDQVEKLLHVSDATATRYLSILEKEGKIKQVGKTGQAVVYSKI